MKGVAGKEAMAIYYLPDSEEPQLMSGAVEQIEHLFADDCLQQGFVFAPFEVSTTHPLLLIKADTCLSGRAAIEDYLESYDLDLEPTPFTFQSQGSRSDFVAAVARCVKTIKASETLSKVVLSRPMVQDLDAAFSPWTTLRVLHEQMPRAFCFWLNIPDQGGWMGATPERLLEVRGTKAQTNALAGTLALDADRTWTAKEYDEQQIVTDYIARHLAQAKIEKYRVIGPETISSGSVKHLKTVFEFEIENDRQLADIVTNLHPTPAVCGMPKEASLAEIKTLENYDRAYYTGYLGPVGLNDETRLFVNLRSMQLGERVACLYIGAGITQDSDPQKEWEETAVKAQTLLNVITC